MPDKRTLFATFLCGSVALTTSAGAQELERYENCLINKFSEQYRAFPEQISGISDIENLLRLVSLGCFVELDNAAREHISIMDLGDPTNQDLVRATRKEVEENSILDLTVEIHTRFF